MKTNPTKAHANSPGRKPMRGAISLLLWMTLSLVSQAQTVPSLVNYQGRLSNPDGSPLPTADYALTFNVYDASTNGALVWGPQVFDGALAQGHGAKVPVVQGYFNVMLGPADTSGRSLADAFNAANRFVEIAVSNRPPIAPRQQILSAPFALQAGNSAKLAGYDWSAVFGTNNPMVGTIPFTKLAPREVGSNVGVGGLAVSPTIATNIITSGSNYSVQVSLVVSSRPVLIAIVGPEPGLPGQPIFSNLTSAELHRDEVLLDTSFGPSSQILDASATPGIHTYKVTFIRAGGGSAQVSNFRLAAFEL